MRISELTTPQTPEQQRVASLQAAKDRASDALANERQRQKIAKAQKALAVAKQSSTTAKPAGVV